MITPANYIITETLYKGAEVVVYRGVRKRDGLSVIIKTLRAESSAPRVVERLRREYDIAQKLDSPFVFKPYGLETEESRPMLVFKDAGGEPLSRLLGAPMEMVRFLDIACRLAAALTDIHGRGIIHKDIKPVNILILPHSREIRLTDFGISSPLARIPPPSPPASRLIEGSPAYMSPEQTGRMNRSIDHRTDLYSLGVTFYEMLTGMLPFKGADLPEWVHCHIARKPKPPHHVVPTIPRQVSAIVMKLLAKQAEERYQSARGLLFDLERCREQWTSQGQIVGYPLGEHDVSDLFLIPQKLYGREEEIASLANAFERVLISGRPELTLISGYSGIGKSSLVRSLSQSILGVGGYFISGKFEQQREHPYITIGQAFRDLIQQILTESDETIRHWREKLQEALGVGGRLIVDIIPRVELIIGPQPPVPELPLLETEGRFHLVFQKFVEIFAKKEHPLALFLDDLQWVDPADLKLITHLITHPDTHYLFLLGAYRDNEVRPSHPLMIALDEIRKSGAPVREIVLGPLTRRCLTQLIADTVHRPEKDVATLARLVHDKTAGNPFFAIQFLATLYQERLLTYDAGDACWKWDVEAIHRQGFTDNIVELMVGKLKRFSEATQETLKLAACLGNTAEVRTLTLICECSEAELHGALHDAVNEGLLVRLADSYLFLHDRVREAAYGLIAKELRAGIRLHIGRLLIGSMSDENVSEHLFDIVSHFNRGLTLISDDEERRRVAALNLRAGRKAKASTAYATACAFLAAGAALLGDEGWESDYELSIVLCLERAECEYLRGGFAEAERYLALALRHARIRADKAAAFKLLIELYTISDRIEKAVESLLECALLFGMALERHPSAETVKEHYDKVMQRLGGYSIEKLIDLPSMSDPDIRAFVNALMAASPPVANYDDELHFAIVSEAVRLSIEYGNSPASVEAYAHFGTLLGSRLGNYRDGYRFGKLSHDLVERNGLVARKARSCAMFSYGILPWTQHVSKALPYLEEGLRAGAETGDLVFACYCCCCLVSVLLARGDPLDEVDREAARMLRFVRDTKYVDVEDALLTQRRLIFRLRNHTSPPASAGNPPLDDEGLEARIQSRMPTVLCWYYIRKLQERFLAGEYQEALLASIKAKEVLWTSTHHWESCEYSYFLSLTLSALYAKAPSREQGEYLRTLRDEVERNRVWAENCPENFLNRYALVAAELARIEGRESDARRLYDQAVQSAHENGFIQNEALAYELAARFCRVCDMSRIADIYVREARTCYLRWRAEGKVRQLDRLYPQLAETRPPVSTGTLTVSSEQLDLLWVIKASQSISHKILLPDLQETLMRLVLEQSGAQRALLLMGDGGSLTIHAQAEIKGEETQVDLTPALPVVAGKLPMSILSYVRRTGEAVVLADAATESIYVTDEYIARRKPRSVLCLPIVRQTGIVGLLYLENSLTAGAFTAHTRMTLELLASQAAISLESASLYLNLRKENADRRRAEGELRQHREHLEGLVALRTKELAAAKAKAEEADRLKSSFLATMSHELRTPLNSIIGFTGIMLQGLVGPLNDEQQLQMGMVKRSARHLLDLINDVLDLSKIEAGEVELRPERFDLRALIDKTVLALKPLADKKSLEITTDIPAETGQLFSDPRRVEQILINLLNNALKFTEEGQVRIECRTNDNSLLIRVSDTGIGIKPEDLANLFVTFRQLDGTLGRKHEGTGLGLSICRKLAALLGGEIQVESAWGSGSTFTLVLPLTEEGGKCEETRSDYRG